MHTTDTTPMYLDPSQPLAERVQDLISRMTLDEKIGLMLHTASGVPRLNIPAYNYWSEALHGVAANGQATVFPQAIGLAAAWDPAFIQRIASAIATEGRAKYHAALRRKGFTGPFEGLTFWSPNINIFRDPRWGRGQETYGEDPFLTGELGAAFVRGLQGDDPKYLKAAACAKHFAAHSGPEKDRHHFDAQISPRDLHDTYLPAFKKLVTEAGVEAVMGAYNRLNGEPCCASQFLIVDLLRGQWRFGGHFVSDCWAIKDIYANHHCVATPEEAVALALKMGCDLNCGCTYAPEYIKGALQQGLMAEADLDAALTNTLRTRFKLGMFDPQEDVPYAAITMDAVNCPEHRQLAYNAAVRSVVLLKNDQKLLPIQPDAKFVFVTGPNAANLDVLLSTYTGFNSTMTTVVEGVTGRAPEGMRVSYRIGCQLIHENLNPTNWAMGDGKEADVTIACMGLSPLLEAEEGDSILTPEFGDRTDIALPEAQRKYLKALLAQGARIVLVLFGGSPIALGELAEQAAAIVWVGYPGQAGGRAIADVLFGDHAPSGKLPMTFPASVDQLPPFNDYRMTGRTYRYMTAEPLYPFGFGLSYTTFAYSALTLATQEITAGSPLPVSVEVTNTGARVGEEVVQFYLSDLEASTVVPLHKLIGFTRVRLERGECTTVTFTVTPEMLMFIDDQGQPQLEPGEFRLTVGGCSPSPRIPALGAPEPVSAMFQVI